MTTDYLVLTHTKRPCRRCKELTFWTTERYLTNSTGLCLDHAGALTERAPHLSERQTLLLLLSTFTGSCIGEPPQRPVEGPTRVAWRWVGLGVVWHTTTEGETDHGH